MEKKFVYNVQDSKGNIVHTFSEQEWLEQLGKQSHTQQVGAELLIIANEIDCLAEKLYKKSDDEGIVSLVEGKLKAFASVMHNISADITNLVI